MPKISLCMVVRNEAKVLPRLFKHVRPVVDELVVFDQSSDDDTGRICKEFGATLDRSMVIRTTRKNLADIDRQDCYNISTGNYVLALDADERPDDGVMKLIAEIRKDGGRNHIYWFSFRNLVDGIDIKEVLKEDWHPRLWVREEGRPPVLEWPTKAHTFPTFNTENQIFSTRGKIDHIRTLDKIKFVASERRQVIDPQNQQLEANFGMAVEDFIARKKGRRR